MTTNTASMRASTNNNKTRSPRKPGRQANRLLFLAALLLLLLLSFGLRLHRAAYDSVWWDEGYSVWMARLPLHQMAFETAHDAHPPLSYLLLHGWRELVGDEELALRTLSVFCGLLTVAVAYQIGRSAGGVGAGLLGALLAGLARLPVWWSQEIRMYAPTTLFAALALWATLQIFARRRLAWLWYGLLTLSLAAGYLTLYLFAGVSRRGQRLAWAVLVIGALLPPLIVYLLSIPRGQFNSPTPSPRYFLLLSTAVYALVGWGIAALYRLGSRLAHWSAGAALLLLVGLSSWSLLNYYSGLRLRDDYISLAATLEALRQPDDAVILNNDTDWPIFAYHYPYPFERIISKSQQIVDEKYPAYLLSPYREGNDGVWLVQTRYAEVTDPENRLGTWLRQRCWNWRQYRFPEGQLWFYAMNQERGDPNLIERAAGRPPLPRNTGRRPANRRRTPRSPPG
ncbi:MAG: glycosyltransferase family 39 protein [Chloroflexota bacterium]